MSAEHQELTEKYVKKLEESNSLLRNALIGLVGADTKEELELLEATVRMMPAPEADKISALNGIHALLATL